MLFSTASVGRCWKELPLSCFKWRDPEPITPLSDMEATMADTERQLWARRFYSNAWVTRHMAGMPGAL